MKIAFHFDSSHKKVKGFYGYKIGKEFFGAILRKRNLHLRTKVFVGDVFFHNLGARKKVKGSTETIRYDPKLFHKRIDGWVHTGNHIFSDFTEVSTAMLWSNPPYAIILDSVDYDTTLYLSAALKKLPYYIGALEVDDTSPIHFALYQLIPIYRILGRDLHVFWDGISEESKNVSEISHGTDYGFSSVEFESLNGRFSIFDGRHNFEAFRMSAELRSNAGGLLSFLIDSIVSRLEDAIPEIADRLWAAMDSLRRAETAEQYSQVASSCRRILEAVIDSLEPPLPGDQIFGEGKFKNRIKKFADGKIASDTILSFVSASGDEFKRQVDRLTAITNQGVHADIIYSEARRCFIRLLILIDDVLALNPTQFDICIKHDTAVIERMIRNIEKRVRKS